MVNAGSVAVSAAAIVLGVALGVGGVFVMLQAGSFFSAESEGSTFLGLFGESRQSASAGTPAFVGLLAALLGVSLLLFGFRALFVAFEGRGAA